MRVLLAPTPEFFPAAFKWTPPTGLLYLGAVLRRAGVEVRILDPYLEGLSPRAFVNAVVRERPDLFGLYVVSDTYFTARQVVSSVHDRLPGVFTVFGGPHPTLLPGEVLRHTPGLDALVAGDGEEALPELVRRLEHGQSLDGVPNLYYRDGAGIVANPTRKMVEDLDTVPFPAYDLVDLDRYGFSYPVPNGHDARAANLITSRGCPYDCLFCSNTNLTDRVVRWRSIPNVMAEIAMLTDRYKVEFLWIQDDAFNLKPQRVEAFCEALRSLPSKVYWSCIMRADHMTRELLERMKACGFVGGYFAAETTHDHLREQVIGKNIRFETIRRTIDWFNELDLWCGINFVVSLPGQTRAEMETDMCFIEDLRLRNRLSSVNLNILRIYPGTRLEKLALDRGVLKPGFSWHDEKRMRACSPGVLPGLYGRVPIYRDHLTYIDIFECLFRWRFSRNWAVDPGKSDSMLVYLWRYLRAVRTPKDLVMLALMGVAFIRTIWRRMSGGRRADR